MTQDDDFRAYVDGASARLLRVSYLLVGSQAAAEDLLQDVLEKLYQQWDRVQEPDAYVRRALANGAANRWRRNSYRRETALLPHHDRPGPDPRDDRRDELLTALASLPHRQRAVVVLRFLDDLSVEQVAGLLNVTTGTVKGQTARALPRLRALLSLDEETCP